MKRLWLARVWSPVWSALARQARLHGDDTRPKARGSVKLTEEALRLHRSALVVDGHNDLPWQFREKADLSFRKIDIRKIQKGLHTDIPRLRKGGVGAQFWAAYVPASTASGQACDTLEQIDVIHRMVQAYPETSRWPYGRRHGAHPQGGQDRVADRRRGRPFDRQFARRAANYYALGVRYMTLTHSGDARLGRLGHRQAAPPRPDRRSASRWCAR